MITTLTTVFRYRALQVFRTLGDMYYWLRNGWRPPLIGFIVTAVVICLLNYISPVHNAKTELWYQEWENILSAQWWNIVVVYMLLVLLRWTWKARKRVIIEDFMDYTTNPSQSDSKGLATLLVVKLARLQQLYRVVDEQRALSTEAKSNQAIDATIKVEDVSNFFTSAISAQSKFSLGPIEIPIGTLLSLIGHIVQGPRILGSLHKDKDVLTLTAQRIDNQTTYSWHVHRKPLLPIADQDTYDLDDMINELAFRMFTDLALNGSVRWRATATFSEGLQFYRDCLRTPEGRKSKLKQAEKRFIETLGEDREFASANYNLGILYMEMEQLQAAEDAFQRAIGQNPSSWRGYYALAVCRSKRKQFESVKSLCELVVEPVITRKPGIANIAKVYHSLGLAQSCLIDQNPTLLQSVHQNIGNQSQIWPGPEHDKILELDGVIQNLDEAIRKYKKAVTFSWRALCGAELLKEDVTLTENRVIPQRESVASVCQIDLAIAYSKQAQKWRERADLWKQIKGMQRKRMHKRIASKHAMFAFGRASTLFKRAEVLFHYATFLTPSNTDTYSALVTEYTNNYFNIAKMYSEWGKFDEAIEEYLSALHINPEDFKCWAYLSVAYAKVSQTQKITLPTDATLNEVQGKGACEKALRYLSSASSDTLNDIDTLKDVLGKIQEAYKELDDEDNRNIAEHMTALLEKYCELVTSADRDSKQVGQKDIRTVADFIKQFMDLTKDKQVWEPVQYWVYTQVSPVLGFLSLASEMPEEAKEHFTNAINLFGKIQAQGLRALLVYALLTQKEEYDKALQMAEQARVLTPHGYFEWEALGDTHFTLNQFEDAIEAWQEALSRRHAFMPNLSEMDTSIMNFKLGVPYLPKLDALDIPYKNILYKLGISYRDLAQYTRDLAKRGDALKQAFNYFKQAQDLYEGDSQDEKRSIHYFLGFLHFEFGEYHDAISYLQIAKTSKFAPLTSLFYLAYAYLKNKDYNAALEQFNLLHREAEKLAGKTPLSDLVETEYGGFMSLGEIRALAHWGIAFTNAERNTTLQEALKTIEEAQHYIDDLVKSERPVHFPGNYKDCKGWILLKMGKRAEAIPLLKQATSLSSNPEVYLHLALAYEQQLQVSGDNTDLLQEMQICCQHVQELDIRKEYEQQVSEILRHHQEKSK